MNRQQKADVVQLLRAQFDQSAASFLVNYAGLTVAQMQRLRKQLLLCGGELKVAKARLMSKALENSSVQCSLKPFLKSQIALVFGGSNSPAIAKVLHDFSKEYDALKLVAGCVENQLLNSAAIVQVASLPSREVLLAQLCGTLRAPMNKMALVLNMLLLRLVWTLKQIEEKKQASGL